MLNSLEPHPDVWNQSMRKGNPAQLVDKNPAAVGSQVGKPP